MWCVAACAVFRRLASTPKSACLHTHTANSFFCTVPTALPHFSTSTHAHVLGELERFFASHTTAATHTVLARPLMMPSPCQMQGGSGGLCACAVWLVCIVGYAPSSPLPLCVCVVTVVTWCCCSVWLQGFVRCWCCVTSSPRASKATRGGSTCLCGVWVQVVCWRRGSKL